MNLNAYELWQGFLLLWKVIVALIVGGAVIAMMVSPFLIGNWLLDNTSIGKKVVGIWLAIWLPVWHCLVQIYCLLAAFVLILLVLVTPFYILVTEYRMTLSGIIGLMLAGLLGGLICSLGCVVGNFRSMEIKSAFYMVLLGTLIGPYFSVAMLSALVVD